MKLQTYNGKLLLVDGKLTADPNCCCEIDDSCCCGPCISLQVVIEGVTSLKNISGNDICPACNALNGTLNLDDVFPNENCFYGPELYLFGTGQAPPLNCDDSSLNWAFDCNLFGIQSGTSSITLGAGAAAGTPDPPSATAGESFILEDIEECFGEFEYVKTNRIHFSCDLTNATAKLIASPCTPPPPIPENQVVWGDSPVFWGSEPVLWGASSSSSRKKAGMGPGDRLAQTFWFLPKCPECQMMQAKMNSWGDDCVNHMDEILDHLQRQAKRRHIPFIRSAVELLVRRAISGRLRNTPPRSGSNSKDSSGPAS